MTMASTLTLGPAVVNITGVRAGDRNSFQLTITDGGTPVNLTGQTITAHAREVATDPNPPAITATITIVNAPAGILTVAFPGAAVTAALAGTAAWSGVWDLQMQSGATDPVTLVAGTLDAVSDVTRP
jgi:hypothetical protein